MGGTKWGAKTTVTQSLPSRCPQFREERGKQELLQQRPVEPTGGQGGKRQALLEMRGEMEDSFLMELIFKLDLEEPMLLRRKDMRRAEKYSNDRQYQSVNQVRYKTMGLVEAGGPMVLQMAFRKAAKVLTVERRSKEQATSIPLQLRVPGLAWRRACV